MNISLKGTVWRIVESNGHVRIQASESRKDPNSGSWTTQNSFWGFVSDKIKDQVKALQIPNGDKSIKAPFCTIEGYITGMGAKQADGTYGNGVINITKIEPYNSSNSTTTNTATNTAPAAPAAVNPLPASNPIPSSNQQAGFVPIPDDDELPFN